MKGGEVQNLEGKEAERGRGGGQTDGRVFRSRVVVEERPEDGEVDVRSTELFP